MMTSKPKRKAPPTNFFARVWREFLFTREFYFETEASPEACMEALREHGHSVKGWFDQYREEVVVGFVDTNRYQFKIEAQHRWKDNYRTVADASGDIYYNEAAELTIVEGTARFDIVKYVIGVFVVIMVLLLFLHDTRTGLTTISKAAPFLLFIGTFGVLGFLQMFRDRNRIVNEIEQTVRNLLSKKEEMNGQHSDASAAHDKKSSS
jgi:hypothetical protein